MKDKVIRTNKEIKEAIKAIEKIKKETYKCSAFEGSPHDILNLQILVLKHRLIKESLLRDLDTLVCHNDPMSYIRIEYTQWFLIGLIEIDELIS